MVSLWDFEVDRHSPDLTILWSSYSWDDIIIVIYEELWVGVPITGPFPGLGCPPGKGGYNWLIRDCMMMIFERFWCDTIIFTGFNDIRPSKDVPEIFRVDKSGAVKNIHERTIQEMALSLKGNCTLTKMSTEYWSVFALQNGAKSAWSVKTTLGSIARSQTSSQNMEPALSTAVTSK